MKSATTIYTWVASDGRTRWGNAAPAPGAGKGWTRGAGITKDGEHAGLAMRIGSTYFLRALGRVEVTEAVLFVATGAVPESVKRTRWRKR